MSLSILNYGAGNLKSITNLLEYTNTEYKIITSKEEIETSDILILPGVGHFDQLMDYFTQNELITPLKNYINSGKPYLGICLGMQILFESSEEAPDRKGLNIFPGKVIRFQQGKVPQIGWNKLNVSPDCKLLTEDYVYFVNSYCIQTDKTDIIAATTNYYIDFVSAVEYKNIFAMQFHPEKSGKVGGEIIKRWLQNVN
ncbi:MAG: imidazole glycerol phosphate synthase subunit HisH [Vampirovibrionia bacterium]